MTQDLSYEDALAYVASLEGRGWRLGLDRMQAFCSRIGLSHALGDGDYPLFIHVAGTNGKGTVTALVQSILHAAGYKVGGYFSPYVYDVRERIQIGNELIPKEDFARLVAQLAPHASAFDGSEFDSITEFEFKTAMGFAYWQQMGCDIVACEVGLGGKLDATNVLTPISTVVTSIGLDHTSLLGATYWEIATEKAGILKEGIPSVLGEMPTEALEAILGTAQQLDSKSWVFGREIRLNGRRMKNPVRTKDFDAVALHDRYFAQNACLAVSAIDAAGIDIQNEAIDMGIQSIRLPGRRQIHSRFDGTWILDGAHNSESARALAEWIRANWTGRKVVLLTSMLTGHDSVQFYAEFQPLLADAVFTAIDFFRAADPFTLREAAKVSFRETGVEPDVQAAIRAARKLAGEDGIVLVTGSFYLVGTVGRLIGADQPVARSSDPLRSASRGTARR